MKTRVYDIKRLIEQKEAQRAAIDKEIEALKIELANIVLNDMDEGRDKRETSVENIVTLVSVSFNGNGKTYDYIWAGDEEVHEGDTVMVETKWGAGKTVEVVRVHKQLWFAALDEYKHAYPAE